MSSPHLGDGAQTGDWSSRDSAGRDIYQGLSGEQLAKLLEQQTEFYMTLTMAYERQASDTNKKLERLRDENDMWRAGEAAKREARQTGVDAQQAALDRRLGRIEGALIVLALILALLAWRLWPAITAVVALASR